MEIAEFQQKAKLVANKMVADRAQVDLFYFCKYVLKYGDILDPKVHGPLCRALRPLLFYQNPDDALKYEFPSDYGREESEGLPTEEEKLKFFEWEEQFVPNVETGHAVQDKLVLDLTSLLCLMPRGTLKSSVITIGFALQWLLNFGDDRVLIDSETWDKSKAFLTEIKGYYEDSPEFRQVFYTIYGCYPNDKKTTINPAGTETWSTSEIVLACRSRKRKEPSIDTAGIEVTKNGMHYDLVLMDDLHSNKNAKTPEARATVKEHYRLVYSLLEPNHPAVVIGTRWDDDDLYQMIIDEESEEFNFITRSAVSDNGDLFYEKRLNHKTLANFRKKQGPYIFSCQYLNNPVDDETATFRRSHFTYFKPEDVKEKPINWYGLVDPSWKGETSDYAVIMIGGMDDKGELYCLYIHREKMTYPEIVKKMFDVDAVYKPRQWLLETIASQKSIQYFLEQERMRQNRALRIKEIRGQRKHKEERIMGLSSYYEMGRAHHNSKAPQIDILESELIRFPKSKYDDVSDCWAGILEIATPARGVILSTEKRTKRKSYLKMLNKPRSPMVGY
jgi:predicted phage terminase large subunit-like protein